MNEEKDFVYVTYIYPIQFIVSGNEKLNFTIEEINNLSYDHSLLHRIIGIITNSYNNKEVEYIVCGDGALGIKKENGLAEDDLVVHYNDLLCKLYLGGMNVEAVTNRDITNGSIYKSESIWPVNFGKSWNSHIHAELRMKVVGVTDAIILFQPENRTIAIEEIRERLKKGREIVGKIPNLSTYHLINGITEFNYNNWTASLTFLWVIVEEITDYLWIQNVVNSVNGYNTKRRKDMLKDYRTYTMAVKQEILLRMNVLSDELYNNIFDIRQARNKLVHEGKLISKEIAVLLFKTVEKLLTTLT